MTGHPYEADKCDNVPQCCSEANLLVRDDYILRKPFVEAVLTYS
jgi:hypothetical protein